MVFYYCCHVAAAVEDTKDQVTECAVFQRLAGIQNYNEWFTESN